MIFYVYDNIVKLGTFLREHGEKGTIFVFLAHC